MRKHLSLIAMLVSLVLFPAAVSATCNSPELEKFQKFSTVQLIGDGANRRGELEKAEQAYKTELTLLPVEGIKRIVALERIGSNLINQRKFSDAMQYIGQADRALVSQFGDDHIYRTEILRSAATALFYVGREKGSEKMITDSQHLHKTMARWINSAVKAWDKNDNGDFVHSASQAKLPQQIGSVPLNSVNAFQLDCLDVSAGFTANGLKITVYLSKVGHEDNVKQELERVAAVMKTRLNVSKLHDQGKINSLKSTMPGNGHYAVVRYGDKNTGEEYFSSAYLIQAGAWAVKVRATYPVKNQVELQRSLNDLWSNMTWPQ